MASYGTTEEGYQGEDLGSYGGMGNSFGEKSVRLGFIRKVYSLLCAQLVLTMAFIGFFFIKPVGEFARENTWLMWVAMVVSFALLITLACCESVRRKSPQNLIFLGLFTAAEGWLVGMICSTYQVTEVLIAVAVTAGVVLALTLFAMQTKIDFTAWGGALLAVLVVFVLAGLIAVFFKETRTVRLVYASIGAIIFSLYIIFDTQMMLGGKHKYALDPEEYVFASLNLYLDIINLFLYLLQIIGAARN